MIGFQVSNLVVWQRSTDRGTFVHFKPRDALADEAATLTLDEVQQLRARLAELLPPWQREEADLHG